MNTALKILGLSALGFFLFSFKKRKKSNSDFESLAIQAVENSFGLLSNQQLESIRFIVDDFYTYGDGDGSKLAYILATAWHESRLKPIKEIRAAQGTPLYSQQNTYWNTGYYGRGFVQLTHLANYQKMSNFLGVDLVNNPDLALTSQYASKILVYGMYNGSFTGKKLSDYIGGQTNDFFNARRIVNGLDKAQLINNYAKSIVDFNPDVA